MPRGEPPGADPPFLAPQGRLSTAPPPGSSSCSGGTGGTSDTFSGFFIKKISGMIAKVTMAMNQKMSLKASICA